MRGKDLCGSRGETPEVRKVPNELVINTNLKFGFVSKKYYKRRKL